MADYYPADAAAAAAQISSDAVQVEQSGSHAQFVGYGAQEGDGTPTISGEEQLRQTVEAIMAFVEK